MGRNFFHLSPYPGTRVYEENKDKIIAKFGTMHDFLCSLGDARDFVINLTDWTDEEYAISYKYINSFVIYNYLLERTKRLWEKAGICA